MDAMDFSKFRDTGELSDIIVIVNEKEFRLHKFPMYIKSEFFKVLVKGSTETNRVELKGFPGGEQTFNEVADFCYNVKLDVTMTNVVYLRCAGEFLQMTGKGNLCDVTERYLLDVLTSAKLSRSTSVIVDMLLHCCKLGKIADQAGIVTSCIEAIVHIWLKPPTKFSTPNKRYDRRNPADEDSNFGKLSKLPLELFQKLISTGKERVVWPKILANAVQIYIDKHLFPGNNEKSCQVTSDCSFENDEQTADISSGLSEKTGGTPEKPEALKLTVDEVMAATVMDTLILELPNDSPLEEVATAKWTFKALSIAENNGCKCRPRLMKLAAEIIPNASDEDLGGLSTKLICEITEEANKNEKCVPDVVSKVIDNYLLGLARKGELTLDGFLKLAQAVPRDFRPSHDLLFEVLEAMLLRNNGLTEEKKKDLLSVLDFSRLNEETLKRAHERELVPASYLTHAALDLCSRLRNELETARAIIRLQEEDINRISKARGIGTPPTKTAWASEPNTPRSRFVATGANKFRKDDVNTSTATSGVSPSSVAAALRNGEKELKDDPSTTNTSKGPNSSLSLDLTNLTDFSSSGINSEDVKEVMNGLADISPRFSNIYLKTITEKW